MKLLSRSIASILLILSTSIAWASTSLRDDSFDIYEVNVVGDSQPDLVFIPIERWVLIGVTHTVPIKVKDSEAFALENLGDGQYRIVSFDAASFDPTGIASLSSYKLLAGDVTGDGRGDLVLQPKDSLDDLIVVLGSSGSKPTTLSFAGMVEGVDDLANANIRIEDVNNDGRVELVIEDTNGNTLTAHYSNGFNATLTERTGALVGQTKFDYSVTQGGAASVTVPINVPKGPAGHTPSIAINYNSQRGNGLLGIGGSLSAYDVISRCKPRKPQSSTIKWNSSDLYCAAGEYLVEVASISSTEKHYRTEIDNGALYIAKGIGSTGPSSWEVHRKDGSVAKYGDSDSRKTRHKKSNSSVTEAWALSSVSNKFNATYTYTYRLFASTEYLLDEINYADVTVKFGYQSRPDKRVYWNSGSKKESTVRLSQIRSTKGSNSYREYAIGYSSSAANGLATLSSVQECVNSSACLPKLELKWVAKNDGATFGSHALINKSSSQFTGLLTTDVAIGDFDGDGRSDVASYSNASSGRKIKIKFGNTSLEDYSYTPLLKATSNSYYADDSYRRAKKSDIQSISVVDHNADGKSDIVISSAYSYVTGGRTSNYKYRWLSGKDKDWSTRSSSYSGTSQPSGSDWSCSKTKVGDECYLMECYPIYKYSCSRSSRYNYHYDAIDGPTSWTSSPGSKYSGSCPTPSSSSPGTCEYEQQRAVSSYSYFWHNDVSCRSENEILTSTGSAFSSTLDSDSSSLERKYFGNTSGTFGETTYTDRWCPANETDPSTTFRGNITTYADVNGDGRDKKFLQVSNALRFYSSSSSHSNVFSAGAKDQFYFVDINQDGLTDVIRRNSTLSVRISKGNNSFDTSQAASGLNLHEEDKVAFIDANRDGLVDVVYTDGKNVRLRLTSISGGKVVLGGSYKTLFTTPDTYASLYTGDFNGDSLIDLAYVDKSDKTKLVVRNGGASQPKLEEISDKFGEHARFEYKNAFTTDVYTPTKETLTVDEIKYLGSGELVSKVTTKEGAGYYKYAGGLIHRPKSTANAAKGFTGFENIVHVTDRTVLLDDETALITLTNYAVDFPLSGRVKEIQKRVQKGVNAPTALSQISFPSDGVVTFANGENLQRNVNFRNAGSTGTGSSTGSGLSNFGAPSKLVNSWTVSNLHSNKVHYIYQSKQAVTQYDFGDEENETSHTEVTTALNTSIANYPRAGVVTTKVWPNESAASGTATSTKTQIPTYENNSSSGKEFYEWFLVKEQTTSYTDGSESLTNTVTNTFKTNSAGKNVVDITAANEAGSQPKRTQFDYDNVGNVTTTTLTSTAHDEPSRKAVTNMDSFGIFVLSTEDNLGVNAQFSNLDIYGNPKRTVHVNGLASSSYADALGRTVSTTDIYGNSTTVDRGWCDQVNHCPSEGKYFKRVMGETGGDLVEYYNHKNQVVLTAELAFNSANTNGSAYLLEYRYVQTEYDALDRVKRQSLPKLATLGSWAPFNSVAPATVFEYDELNRIVKETRPSGLIVKNTYTAFAPSGYETFSVSGEKATRIVKTEIQEAGITKESYTNFYNELGLHTATQNKEGNWLWFEYDAKGRKTKTYYNKANAADGSVDSSSHHVLVTEYDEYDRVVSVDDPNVGKTTSTYTRFDELKTTTNSINKVSTNLYDSVGNLVKTSSADGTVTCYAYDTTSGLVDSRTLSWMDVRSAVNDDCTSEATDAKYSQSFINNGFGQLLQKTTTASAEGSTKSVTESYQFDEWQRPHITSLVVDGSLELTTQDYYDPYSGQWYARKATRDGNEWRYVVNKTDVLGNTEVAKLTNENNEIVYQQARHNQTTGAVEYKALSTDEQGQNPIGDYQTSWHYEFNQRGYLTAKWEGGIAVDKAASTNVYEYAYDDQLNNRLKSVTVNDIQNEYYEYDFLGNIRSKTTNGGSFVYKYDNAAPHQLTSITDNLGEYYSQEFEQGDTGNVEISTLNGIDRSYARDDAGNIVGVSEGSTTQSYHYIGNSIFASRKNGVSGDITNWYLSGLLEIKEGVTDELVLKALPGLNITITAGFITNEYVLTDHLGSVQAIAKDTNINQGELDTFEYEFESFGFLLEGEQSESDKIFTDHEYAIDLNIIHMQGRVYNPVVGQFLSADPVVKHAHNLQHYNRYSYVGNNPLSYTDPTGFTMQQHLAELEALGQSIVDGGDLSPGSTGIDGPSTYQDEIPSFEGSFAWNAAVAMGGATQAWGNDVTETTEGILNNPGETANNVAQLILDFPMYYFDVFLLNHVGLGTGADTRISVRLDSMSNSIVEGYNTTKVGLEEGDYNAVGNGLMTAAMFLKLNNLLDTDQVTKGAARQYWTNSISFQGIRVYQRDDIFDPDLMTSWRQSGKTIHGTNVERMASGRAPIGYDGKSVNLHHMTQRNDSPIAEMTQTFHQQNSSVIHINPNTIPSGINRSQFDTWKANYWSQRAKDF